METDHDYKVLEAMRIYGGSFVVALSEAFRRADRVNFYKLKKAFPEYWKQYSEMAEKM